MIVERIFDWFLLTARRTLALVVRIAYVSYYVLIVWRLLPIGVVVFVLTHYGYVDSFSHLVELAKSLF